MATEAPNKTVADIDPQVSDAVTKALENPKYEWRSLPGLATETGLPQTTVRQTIDKLLATGLVIRSSVDAEDGSALYTTRAHYREKASVWNRIMAAVRNRAN